MKLLIEVLNRLVDSDGPWKTRAHSAGNLMDPSQIFEQWPKLCSCQQVKQETIIVAFYVYVCGELKKKLSWLDKAWAKSRTFDWALAMFKPKMAESQALAFELLDLAYLYPSC